jgi:uncharacterized protein YbjT (DUF2867 family)
MNEKNNPRYRATRRQGGAAIHHLLQHGFKACAMTQDPEKPSSQSLRAKGVEVFKGDMEDVSSLRPAMKGVYGVFSLQNFWEKWRWLRWRD